MPLHYWEHWRRAAWLWYPAAIWRMGRTWSCRCRPGFPTSVAGVTVSVNGVNAPLIYVSPTQINFQVPWETAPGTTVNVTVTRNRVDGNVEPVTIMSTTAPSVFLNDYTSGVAWVTGAGCETAECAVQAGTEYVLWGNGFGPKNSPLQDGAPAVGARVINAAGGTRWPGQLPVNHRRPDGPSRLLRRRTRPDHRPVELRVPVRRIDWFALCRRDPRDQRRHRQIQDPSPQDAGRRDSTNSRTSKPSG